MKGVPTKGESKNGKATATRDLVKQVKVEVEALVGSARMTVAELDALKADDLIALNHRINEPVTLRLNGQPFARGEIVTVDDKFAIRITELDI